jgi:hypothetical protein
MAKHLGRNPFDKKGFGAVSQVKKNSGQKETDSDEKLSKLTEWALIQVPARSMFFALNTVLRLKNLLERE